MDFLYTELVNLLFSRHILTSWNEKRIIMFMLESKLDIRMFCVHILYKLFQLHLKIKSDKNINIPPINVRTKILRAIRKAVFQNDKEMHWLKKK